MSTSITLIPSNGQLPAYLQQSGLGYQDAGLGAGITPRAPKLGITTDKKFTITKDGQTMQLPPDPHGRTVVRGVLIASAMNITKAWYEKPFVPGSTEAPDCYSDDGRSPAAGVKKPQCSNCAQCPKNAFGSHPITGRGKACSDRKRVIFVWEHLPKELMTFNVPTMSLQALMKLDNELKNANIPLQAVMVELSFDPSVTYPVVKISAVGYVPQEVAFDLINRSTTQEVSDLLRESEFEDDVAPQAGAQSPVPQQTMAMGQANAPQTFPQETVAAGQSYETVAAPQPEKAKRTRRTKAQIEADNLAAMQAKAMQGQQQAPITSNGQQAATDPTTALQAQIEAMQAQLAAQQQQQQQQQPDPQLTVAHSQAELQQAAQQPAATQPAGGMDVQALLNKWQTG